ncbi:MAG: hypothetical protein B6D55_03800 [Candidatus Omnitrophica bacterium 4484_70.2]|nr:MAG: hypothetical protein B6D55_03800 [Candidatus Omnitrophica bacterium 4484_70.2]
MKKNFIDYIVVIFTLLLIFGLSLVSTFYFSKLSSFLFKKYHIFIDVFFLLNIHTILTGIFIRLYLAFRPLKEGTYTMEDKEIVHWKFILTMTELSGMIAFPFIPFFWRPYFFRLFGAQVGRNVEIIGTVFDPSLVKFDDYSIIGAGAIVTPHIVTHNKVVLKHISIGKKVTIGIGALILPGVEIGENSIIAAGAVVPMNTRIPANEVWAGIPARKIKDVEG